MMRHVIGVHRNGQGTPDIELALFEGEFLADQYIDMLYRAEWGAMTKASFPLVSQTTFDRWSNDDRYSSDPLFFKTKHELWSNVPANVERHVGHFDVGAGLVYHDDQGEHLRLAA